MPRLHLDDPMAYRNFILMPPELYQELEQRIKHTDLRHKIEDGSIGFSDSESLGIGGPKVNFFLLGDNAYPPQALTNEALLQPRYGLEGEGLQL